MSNNKSDLPGKITIDFYFNPDCSITSKISSPELPEEVLKLIHPTADMFLLKGVPYSQAKNASITCSDEAGNPYMRKTYAQF